MWGYNHATILKTYHFYEQTTGNCAFESIFTMVTTEEGYLFEGGARIREGRVRER